MNRGFVSSQGIETKGATRDPDKAKGAAWLKEYCLQCGWEVKAMGRLDMLTEPVVTSAGYRIVPFDQDDCKLPTHVAARVQALVEQGFTTDRMLIIHEPDEKDQPKTWPQRLGITPQNAELIRKVLIAVGTAAAAIAVAVVALVTVLVIAYVIVAVVLPIVFLGLALVGLAVGVDPILVYVSEDNNEWYQVAAWREE